MLPPKYRDWCAYVRLDHDRTLGAANRDGPLTTDPSHPILTVDLLPNPLKKPTAFDTRPASAVPGQTRLFSARKRPMPWAGSGEGL